MKMLSHTLKHPCYSGSLMMKSHGHYDTLELRCEISGDFEHDLPSNV